MMRVSLPFWNRYLYESKSSCNKLAFVYLLNEGLAICIHEVQDFVSRCFDIYLSVPGLLYFERGDIEFRSFGFDLLVGHLSKF
jgi:hypothetical protein